MTVTRVGPIAAGGANSGTSFVTTQPQAPSEGSLQLLVVSRSKSGAAATLGGLSGWTLLAAGGGSRLSVSSNGDWYGRWCVGGETAPTITTSVSTALRWSMEEWSGLEPGGWPSGIPFTIPWSNHASGGVNYNETWVGTVADEWVAGVLLGRGGSSGATTHTWDSDLTEQQGTASGHNSYRFTAVGTIPTAGGSLVTTSSAATPQGDGMGGYKLLGFAPLTEPPPPAFPGNVIEAGAKEAPTDANVIEAGAKRAASASVIIGGAKQTSP